MSLVLERDGLLSRLSDHLADAARGEGSLIFLTGEAGAGKSTVIHEFVRAAPTSALTLTGFCDPLSTPRPLGPLLDIVSEPDSGLNEIADMSDVFEIFVAVLDRLEHSIRPIVMVVEDIHWADTATLDMLTFFGRRVRNTKALILATYRGEEITPDHPLRPVVADLITKTNVHRYPVEALSRDAVDSLAAGHEVDAGQIYEVTGGNAFYVTELLATGSGVPPTVQDAVLARVSHLDDEARYAVEGVSIAPRSMSLEHIVSLTNVDPAAVERSLHAGVLVGDESGYKFRHELARLAVEDSIPEPRRMVLHAAMLKTISGTGDLARQAHHAIKTHDPEAIIRYVPAAAREATRRSAHHQAVRLYAAAHPYIMNMSPDDEFEFMVDYSDSLRITNQPSATLAIANEMLEFAQANGEGGFLGVALRIRGKALWMEGDVAASHSDLARSVAVLERDGPSRDLADSLDWAANNQMLDRHYQAGMDLAQRALEVAVSIGYRVNEVQSLQTMGTLELVTGDVARGVELIEDSIAMGQSSSDRRIELVGLEMLGTGGGEVRIYERALRWLDRSIAIGEEMDEDYLIAYGLAWKSRIRCEQGHWSDAIALAGKVATRGEESARIVPVTALGTIGRVRVRRGDPGGVLPLTQAIELGRAGALQHIWVPTCALSEWYWLQGDLEKALEVLREISDRTFDTDSAWGKGEVAFWMWMAGGLDTPPPGSADPFAMIIEGDWEDAAAEWGSIGCPYEQALALSFGDTEARLQAIRILDQLGARPAGQRLRKILRDEGVSSIPRGPRISTKGHPSGLTTRQVEVLGLLQEGLSNSDIATRLFISQKTAEHHVSAILTKLGASSRAEAIALSLKASEQAGT